ncbi:hypothetical protein ACTXT7_013048 [Hymenolepis weldensis]
MPWVVLIKKWVRFVLWLTPELAWLKATSPNERHFNRPPTPPDTEWQLGLSLSMTSHIPFASHKINKRNGYTFLPHSVCFLPVNVEFCIPCLSMKYRLLLLIVNSSYYGECKDTAGHVDFQQMVACQACPPLEPFLRRLYESQMVHCFVDERLSSHTVDNFDIQARLLVNKCKERLMQSSYAKPNFGDLRWIECKRSITTNGVINNLRLRRKIGRQFVKLTNKAASFDYWIFKDVGSGYLIINALIREEKGHGLEAHRCTPIYRNGQQR